MSKKDVPWDPQREWIDELSPEELRIHLKKPGETPTQENLPYVISYSDRAKGEFVISGPIGSHPGHGRRFDSIGDALAWARGVYGPSARHLPGHELPEELVEAGLAAYKVWRIIVKPLP